MALTTWIAFGGSIDADTRGHVVSLLDRSDIPTCTLGALPGARLGVVVFDAVDDALFALLRNEGESANVLALSLRRGALPNEILWRLIHAGATDVLEWPRLPQAAEDVAGRLQRWSQVEALLDSPRVRRSLVGGSVCWRRALRGIVEAAAFTTASVMITGESGTGKELIARLIHELDSRRDKGEFVVVDCTTLSPELSGSEFFGHERGAYTGATTTRDGAFALADRGTLFLDEVGELSVELQAQLLRAVQERKYKRVGSNTWQSTDLRLICATHRDLERGVADGSFRADLFYRLAGWRCRTVPLRARRDDILPLVEHFIAQLLPQRGDVSIQAAVREFLVARDYPGNVRDLRQLVTRICHRHAGSGPISIGDIPPEDWIDGDGALAVAAAWPEGGFRSAVRVAVEQGVRMKDIGQAATELAIESALACEGGNLQRAAARLGVTDRALQIRRASQRSANLPAPSP